jgi:uncharacterized membrane protein SpoIIM required for sporulation
MVLEKIISIRKAVKKPWEMFLIGGVVSVICLAISFIIFPSSVGLFSVFLITIAMTPFMLNLTRYEEARDEELIKKRKHLNLFQRHREVLLIYVAFFAGMIFSLSIIFLMLPETMTQRLFEDQINEINLIRGSATLPGTFSKIVINNIGVLFLAFIFSLLFGAGAVFILAWNASVLSAAIGMAAQSLGGIGGFPLALLAFFPHGSLEILAYFIGGIAGGLVSVAITRRTSKWAPFIFKDSLKLMIASIILLVGAGAIEVMVILM